ncbi:hypothetical protein F0726_02188 [Acidithiobacillus caldus]|nr:hypothetical protein F0726_02188 [Acidithiobacillus caldus]
MPSGNLRFWHRACLGFFVLAFHVEAAIFEKAKSA